MKYYFMRFTRTQIVQSGKQVINVLRLMKTLMNELPSVEAATPNIFQIGDIVKIQVSFIIVPLKDDKHKMMVMLRSIAFLDPHFGQVRMQACTDE